MQADGEHFILGRMLPVGLWGDVRTYPGARRGGSLGVAGWLLQYSKPESEA